jgi:hypothetical protein
MIELAGKCFLWRYVAVDQIKDKLVKNNKKTYWVPDSVKVSCLDLSLTWSIIVETFDFWDVLGYMFSWVFLLSYRLLILPAYWGMEWGRGRSIIVCDSVGKPKFLIYPPKKKPSSDTCLRIHASDSQFHSYQLLRIAFCSKMTACCWMEWCCEF